MRDQAVSGSDGFDKSRVEARKAHLCMTRFGLDLPKRLVSLSCDLRGTTRKLTDARGGVTDLATKLLLNPVRMYDSASCIVYGASVKFGAHRKKRFVHETRSLQRSARDAICAAARRARSSFARPPRAADKKLALNDGHAAWTSEPARPEALSWATANRDAHADAGNSRAKFTSALPNCTFPNKLGAHDPLTFFVVQRLIISQSR